MAYYRRSQILDELKHGELKSELLKYLNIRGCFSDKKLPNSNQFLEGFIKV
jgi:hypothetical protein